MRACHLLRRLRSLDGRPPRGLRIVVGIVVLSCLASFVLAGDDPSVSGAARASGGGAPAQPVLRRADTGGGQPPLRRTDVAPQLPRDRGILRRSPQANAATPKSPKPAGGPSRPAAGPFPRVLPVTALQAAEPLPEPPGQAFVAESFHRHAEPQYDDKPIGSLSTNILPSRGDLPANYAAARFDKAGQEFHTVGTSRPWAELVYDWEATSFCCAPLYFEEPNAERVGHTAGNIGQPFLSGAHFFARIPALPYMLVAEPPFTCVSSLGHDRPGTYAPFRYIRLPLSVGAGVVEAGVIVGLVYLIP